MADALKGWLLELASDFITWVVDVWIVPWSDYVGMQFIWLVLSIGTVSTVWMFSSRMYKTVRAMLLAAYENMWNITWVVAIVSLYWAVSTRAPATLSEVATFRIVVPDWRRALPAPPTGYVPPVPTPPPGKLLRLDLDDHVPLAKRKPPPDNDDDDNDSM